MSTYLQLCQAVARESGTVSGTQPSAVSGQTGRLLKIVKWTNQAWRDIQNAQGQWRWMDKAWDDKALTSGAACYTSASFSISDWGEWIVDAESRTGVVKIYDNSVGVSEENAIQLIPYSLWDQKYNTATHDNARPIEYAISPAGEICFGPTPDSSNYRVSGRYRQATQDLSADGDTPGMPARFHELIVWRALLLLGEHDEGEFAVALAARRWRELMDDLRRDQLPRPHAAAGSLIGRAGPLA